MYNNNIMHNNNHHKIIPNDVFIILRHNQINLMIRLGDNSFTDNIFD